MDGWSTGRLERIAEHPRPTSTTPTIPTPAPPPWPKRCPRSLAGVVVARLAILADKDAAAMVRALRPVLERAICTELPAESGAE